MNSRDRADVLTLLTLVALWGSAFAIIKIAVVEIPPLTIAAGRIALSAMLLLALLALLRVPFAKVLRAGWRRWWQFLVLGLLGNGIPFSLIGFGEVRIDSGLAAILIGTMPIFTVLFARASGVERDLTGWRILGIMLGFAGLLLLTGPAALAGLGGDWLGQIAVIGAAISYAGNAVYGRVLSLTMPITVLAAGNMLACTLVMVPVALIVEQPWQLTPSWQAVGWVVWLGVASTAFGSFIYLRLLLSAGPTFAALINYMIPALGVVVGIAWLGESVSSRELTALGLICAAMALVRPRRPQAVPVAGSPVPSPMARTGQG